MIQEKRGEEEITAYDLSKIGLDVILQNEILDKNAPARYTLVSYRSISSFNKSSSPSPRTQLGASQTISYLINTYIASAKSICY